MNKKNLVIEKFEELIQNRFDVSIGSIYKRIDSNPNEPENIKVWLGFSVWYVKNDNSFLEIKYLDLKTSTIKKSIVYIDDKYIRVRDVKTERDRLVSWFKEKVRWVTL